MDKNKKRAIVYYLVAAMAFICSVIWFCNGKGGFGAMWLCIGSANLCLGTVWMGRSGEAEEQNEEQAGEQNDSE